MAGIFIDATSGMPGNLIQGVYFQNFPSVLEVPGYALKVFNNLGSTVQAQPQACQTVLIGYQAAMAI
jgi:hypothetical protein